MSVIYIYSSQPALLYSPSANHWSPVHIESNGLLDIVQEFGGLDTSAGSHVSWDHVNDLCISMANSPIKASQNKKLGQICESIERNVSFIYSQLVYSLLHY